MRTKSLLVIIIAMLAAAAWLTWKNDRANAPGNHTPSTVVHSSVRKHPTSPVPPTTAQTATPFNKQAHSTTDAASTWVVVNKQHPLSPANYTPADLTPVGNGQYMRAEAAAALKTMLGDAARAGYTVTADSGYRSYQTQVTTYNSEVKAYGQAAADSESARPGYSEHQTGWAVDLGSDGCNITDCFGDTPGGKWVTANAYAYGFILRYPGDKVDITGYRTETWHFRYVGVLLATKMHSQGIETLEEFFGVSGGTTYAQ